MSDYIPVLDMSAMLAGSNAGKEKFAGEIDAAFRQSGFCYISGHGMPAEQIEAAKLATVSFFSLPEQQKALARINTSFRGYSPAETSYKTYFKFDSGEEISQADTSRPGGGKETFMFGLECSADDPDAARTGWSYGPNNWPPAFPDLRRNLYPYYEHVCEIGSLILEAIAIALKIPPGFFRSRYEKPTSQCVLNYYPPMSDALIAAGVESNTAHSDFSALTILYQDDVGGLEVRERSTGEWVAARPIPGTFVINVGDLLARWSNDRYVSTPHRVMNRANQARYSMPVFHNPSADIVIDPIELGVSKEACLYPPVRSGLYQTSRFSEVFSKAKLA